MILLLLSFNSHILIYTGDLVEKLHTGALSRLPRRKRGRRLWRKAQKQPKPDSCSLSHPHAASPKARQGSVLRRRIFPDICAQNTCESGVMNQVLLSKITQWSCFLCLWAVSCTPYTPPPVSPSPCGSDFKSSQERKNEPVLPPRRVEGLYEVGGVSEEHGVAGGAAHHAQHRQPHVRQGLRRESGVVKIQIQELWRERQGEYQGLTCRSRCTTCGTLPWRAPTSIVPTSRSPYKKYNWFFFQFPILKRVLPTALTN